MLDTIVAQVEGWAKHPDKGEDATALDLFLYVGAWVFFTGIWIIIIRKYVGK